MLTSLHIKNYALIDDLLLEFKDGLNIFTGETGAGKSIIIDSLGLILGERASSHSVKTGAVKCFITGEFDIKNLPAVTKMLLNAGIECNSNDPLIVRREIDSQGKSRAFINDTPVGLNTLLETGKLLVDVHGQHEHQTLLHRDNQLEILDSFADHEDLKDKVKKNFDTWKELQNQLNSKELSEQEKQKLIDLYSFQVNEINNAGLTNGEEEEIENSLPQLKNAEKLREMSGEINDLLSQGEGSVLEKANKSKQILENINSLCGALGTALENFNNSYFLLEECSREINDFHESLSADPEKLNELLERQDLLSKLKKKYGTTIHDILEYKDKTAKELEALTQSELNKKELEKKLEKAHSELLETSKKLSFSRKKTAAKLSGLIQKELSELGMKKVQFDISLNKLLEPISNGIDEIEFQFSANSGEPLKPLKSIASGGEMSRLMLALKTVLAHADSVPVLVFDEIDAGIGGQTGQIVGKKLKQLSKNHQVLCITHLPQIAAFYDNHFSVKKEEKSSATRTLVLPLNKGESVEEIARMLSGKEITSTAMKHASELIEQA